MSTHHQIDVLIDPPLVQSFYPSNEIHKYFHHRVRIPPIVYPLSADGFFNSAPHIIQFNYQSLYHLFKLLINSSFIQSSDPFLPRKLKSSNYQSDIFTSNNKLALNSRGEHSAAYVCKMYLVSYH